MDASTIATIASTTVTLLIPYFKSLSEGFAKKAGEELGEKTGESAWTEAKKLYDTIKAKFSKSEEIETITSLEKTPDDADTQAAVRFQLKSKMRSDEKFAAELADLLHKIDRAGADTVFNTTIHGNVRQIIQARDVGEINL